MKSILWIIVGVTVPQAGSFYMSDNFGYSFSYERVPTFCAESPPAPSRGVSFSMEKVSCADLRARADVAYVEFWAEFNVVGQSDGVLDLATISCAEKPKLSRRGFKGLETFECESKSRGALEIRFFSQSKGADIEARVNYYATVIFPKGTPNDELVAHLHRISVGELD